MKKQAWWIIATALGVYAADFSGTVVDAKSGLAVEGVLVSAGYTEFNTRTDSQGKFFLSTSASSPAINSVKHGPESLIKWNSRLRRLELPQTSGLTEASIYALSGRCLLNCNLISSRSIQLNNTPPGIYLLKLKGNDGVRASVKLILSKHSATFKANIAARNSLQTRTADAQSPVQLIFRHDAYYPFNLSVPGSVENITINLNADERSFVFDQTKIRSYHFTLSGADSLFLEQYGYRETYVPAQMQFEDQTIGTVGFRYKGSPYSIPNCFDSTSHRRLIEKEVCRKISFKVKFTEYDPDKRFYSMKRLNLHSMSADATKMHDMLSYELFREMGIFAPRTSYAKVYVNNTYVGLFVAVEDVDGRFTKARWPVYGDGNLYKETWPAPRTRSYFLNGLVTNDKPADNPDVSRMIGFYKAIDTSTAESFSRNLSSLVDFDYLLRYFAVDRAIKNWDGIMSFYGSGNWASNHNFFLYEEENSGGKFWLIPWDLDNTLWATDPYIESAGLPNWNEPSSTCAGYPVWGGSSFVTPPNCDRFIKLTAQLYWNRFVQHGEQFLEKFFQPETLCKKVDAHSQLIDKALQDDPVVSYSNWLNEVSSLKDDFSILKTSFYNHLHGIKPQADTSGYLEHYPFNSHLRDNLLNNFEFAPAASVSGWTYTYASLNSTVSLEHSTKDPLFGTADIHFSFELLPSGSTQPWSEWCGFGMNLRDVTDLTNLKEIQLSLKSDVQRTITISIKSDVYADYSVKEDYIWSVDALPEIKTVILPVDRLGYPTWGNPDNPDIFDEVMSQVSGLAFAPSARFDGAGDLSVNPDVGFLRVDNIRFVFK